MKLLLVAVSVFTVACASAAPEAPEAVTPAQSQTVANAGLSMYEGTYSLQAPNRVIDLRVWVDAEGKLNGELVGMNQQTTFRPNGEHKFMHETRDDVTFTFTVENGRATMATMRQGVREISGPRSK